MYRLRKMSTTRVPPSTPVNQPRFSYAPLSTPTNSSAIPPRYTTVEPAPASSVATTSFNTTPPDSFTVQPPPSYATSSQYVTVDPARVPNPPPETSSNSATLS